MTWKTGNIGIVLGNILNVLATSLYGNDPKCAIRENLQNAHDACLDWVMAGNKAFNVEIHVTIDRDSYALLDEERTNPRASLVIRDSGVGMTEDEVQNYLAKIGGSTKTDNGDIEKLEDTVKSIQKLDASEQRELAEEKIGRFGLGFLAGFIVADCIEIRTQKEGHKAVEAVFTANTDFKYREIDDTLERGTEVRLFLLNHLCRPNSEDRSDYLLDTDRVCEIVRQYCDLLRFPFFVHGDAAASGGQQVTTGRPPWMEDEPRESDYRRFLKDRMPEANDPLVVIPINIDTTISAGEKLLPVRAHGVIYIPDPPRNERQSYGQIDLYVRRMFIREDRDELLPLWATYIINGVLDTPDLTVTLDRNDVVRQDRIYAELQKQLGCEIIQGLKELAETKEADFQYFIDCHDRRIREAALLLEDGNISDFFKSISPNLPVCVLSRENPPPGKLIPLHKFISDLAQTVPDAANLKRLPFFSTQLSRSMVQDVISQDRHSVIDASDDLHRRILDAYAVVCAKEVVLEDIGAKMLSGYVTDVPATEADRWKPFCEYFKSLTHAGDHVAPEVKNFEPKDVPALMLGSADKATEKTRKELSGFLENFGALGAVGDAIQTQLAALPPEGADQVQYRLFLNAKNPLMTDLLEHCENSGESKLPELVELILHQILHDARGYAGIPNTVDMTVHIFKHQREILQKLLKDQNRMANTDRQIKDFGEETNRLKQDFIESQQAHADEMVKLKEYLANSLQILRECGAQPPPGNPLDVDGESAEMDVPADGAG